MVWLKKINENFTKFITPQKSRAELGELPTLCMHTLRVSACPEIRRKVGLYHVNVNFSLISFLVIKFIS